MIVVLTDGQTPWPDEPPCRTVVGLFPRPAHPDDDDAYEPMSPPSWARVVRIG